MMAISQILFSQCHAWDIFGLGLIKQRFFLKKKQHYGGNHGQGTQSAKMGTDSAAQNTPNTLRSPCLYCLLLSFITSGSVHV